MNGDAAREKLAAALMPVIGEVIDERDVHYTAAALLPVVREIAAEEVERIKGDDAISDGETVPVAANLP